MGFCGVDFENIYIWLDQFVFIVVSPIEVWAKRPHGYFWSQMPRLEQRTSSQSKHRGQSSLSSLGDGLCDTGKERYMYIFPRHIIVVGRVHVCL